MICEKKLLLCIGIKVINKNFIQLDISFYISIVAVIISALSLAFSFKVNKDKEILIRTDKITEMSIKIFEAKYILQNILELCDQMSPTQEVCRISVERLKNNTSSQIIECEQLEKNIENLPLTTESTDLEKYWREMQKLHISAKELVLKAEKVSADCIYTHKKARLFYNSLPESQRPGFVCTIQQGCIAIQDMQNES